MQLEQEYPSTATFVILLEVIYFSWFCCSGSRNDEVEKCLETLTGLCQLIWFNSTTATALNGSNTPTTFCRFILTRFISILTHIRRVVVSITSRLLYWGFGHLIRQSNVAALDRWGCRTVTRGQIRAQNHTHTRNSTILNDMGLC